MNSIGKSAYYILARSGGTDKLQCGKGNDVVTDLNEAEGDKASRDCENVSRWIGSNPFIKYNNFRSALEDYERKMGFSSYRGRCSKKACRSGDGATGQRIRSSTKSSTTTNRSTTKADRIATTTKTESPTTAGTAGTAGRPYPEIEKIC